MNGHELSVTPLSRLAGSALLVSLLALGACSSDETGGGGGGTGGGGGAGATGTTSATTAGTTSAGTTAAGTTTATTTTGGTGGDTSGGTGGDDTSGGTGGAGGGEPAAGDCGWVLGEGFSYYDCGGEGVDPSGTFPVECPEGLVEDADCGELTGAGCCDRTGSNWYCDEDGKAVFAVCE